MRRSVVFAAVIAAGAVMAPGASADAEHLFVASDGTQCRVTQTASIAREPGGTNAVTFGSGVRCDKPVAKIFVLAELDVPSIGVYAASNHFVECGQSWNPCKANVTYKHEGTATGLPREAYINRAAVGIDVAAPHVWLLTPRLGHGGTPTGCLPGSAGVDCALRDPVGPD